MLYDDKPFEDYEISFPSRTLYINSLQLDYEVTVKSSIVNAIVTYLLLWVNIDDIRCLKRFKGIDRQILQKTECFVTLKARLSLYALHLDALTRLKYDLHCLAEMEHGKHWFIRKNCSPLTNVLRQFVYWEQVGTCKV